MDKKKRSINAKQFLDDYRKGISDLELMERYDLSSSSLRKFLAMLQEKNLLSPSEIRKEDPADSAVKKRDPGLSSTRLEVLVRPEPVRSGSDSHSELQCRQCGAEVAENMLTCPECGHVLSGEKRWSQPGSGEPSKPRISPRLLGCLIAVPIGVALLLVLKYVFVPIGSVSNQQKTKSHSKIASAKATRTPAAEQQKAAYQRIQKVAERLVNAGILEEADQDYANFTTTDEWHRLSRDEKIKHISAILTAFRESNIEVDFTFFDPSGEWVVRAEPQLVELKDKDGFTETLEHKEITSQSTGSVKTDTAGHTDTNAHRPIQPEEQESK